MKIKIAHLYYDLLNLYGEQGNVISLINAFNNQNVEVEVDYLSIGDKIKLSNYDIVYMGSGSKEDLLIVLEDLKKYSKDINKYIDSDNYFISTGNSYLLFGSYIDLLSKKIDCLNVFPYYAKLNNKRIVGECFMKYLKLDPIVGFQNRDFIVNNTSNHLFNVISGPADNFKSSNEGYKENNFYGTHLIGPLLARNPHFLDLIVENVLKSKGLKFHKDLETLNYKAYTEYLKNFYEE